MRIQLFSIANKMPSWIKAGYEEYAKRLPKELPLDLIEISSKKPESEMLKKIPLRSYIIALDEGGELWSTQTLANNIKQWQMSGRDIVLIIGGADGLSSEILKKANKTWSLSPLTFPHMLVRIIVAEQLYRAFSILSGHPYHRC